MNPFVAKSCQREFYMRDLAQLPDFYSRPADEVDAVAVIKHVVTGNGVRAIYDIPNPEWSVERRHVQS